MSNRKYIVGTVTVIKGGEKRVINASDLQEYEKAGFVVEGKEPEKPKRGRPRKEEKGFD